MNSVELLAVSTNMNLGVQPICAGDNAEEALEMITRCFLRIAEGKARASEHFTFGISDNGTRRRFQITFPSSPKADAVEMRIREIPATGITGKIVVSGAN